MSFVPHGVANIYLACLLEAHSTRAVEVERESSMPICGVPCSLSLEHHSPQVFGSSRLLSQKTYVLARGCLAFNSLYWLIRSVRAFGKVHWLVFLTHWTYALQTLYYFLALGSAAHLWVNSGRKRHRIMDEHGVSHDPGRRPRDPWRDSRGQATVKEASRPAFLSPAADLSDDDDGEPESVALGRARKLQWGLLYLCADTSVIISVVYWAFLYNGWSDQLNLQLHLFNTTFMLVDVMIGASPFDWGHIGITYVYGLLYLAFDIVYYVVGTLVGMDESVIYFFLDWGKSPGKSIAMVIVLFVFAVPLSHGVWVLAARLREMLRRRNPHWGWQGTDQEELERVMELSGMRDADVWAPLTGNGDPELYDIEEEEMGGVSVFGVGRDEEHAMIALTSSTGGGGVRGQMGKRTSAAVCGSKSAV